MIKVTHPVLGIQEQKALENLAAQSVANEQTIEYIAMMSDVDISSDEENGGIANGAQ